jgi:antitoxin component of RelBE/YafQ-DinJ toxin-antitoxin module
VAHILSVRLTDAEHRILTQAAAEIGADVSAIVRTLIQSRARNSELREQLASLADEVRALAIQLAKLNGAGAGVEPQSGSNVAALHLALAAIIEHSLLPAAPMDRKPGLLAALNALKVA